MHFQPLPEACIPSLESFGPIVIKLCCGQGYTEAAATAADPFLLPSQAIRSLSLPKVIK